jgi:hypothetical protein
MEQNLHSLGNMFLERSLVYIPSPYQSQNKDFNSKTLSGLRNEVDWNGNILEFENGMEWNDSRCLGK